MELESKYLDEINELKKQFLIFFLVFFLALDVFLKINELVYI